MPLAARTDDDSPERGADARPDNQLTRGMPEKSAGAFGTIKEAADDLDVPQHVLRFWETRFSQIRPVKRAGGRRYYRPDDLDLLKGIRHLLHGQGYTIRGAQRVLRERGLRFVQSVGRGEAEAAAPPASDAEGPDAADQLGSEGLSPEERLVLEAALRELHACRAAVASLRLPPESDA